MNIEHFVVFDLLQLSLGEYVIYGSGPLGIRGLRKTDDIDVCVSGDAWKKLISSGKYVVVMTKYNNESIVVGNVEVAYTIPGLHQDEIDHAIRNADIIDGHAFLSLDYTLQSKKWMKREKDLRDIALIQTYLSNTKV